MKRTATALVGLAIFVGSSTASAQDSYNTSRFLGAGAASTINKVRARANVLRQKGADIPTGFKPCPGDSVDVGNIHIPRGARAPREVTVVVTGDVTNVSKGKTTAYCR